jgi:hypothetical protein
MSCLYVCPELVFAKRSVLFDNNGKVDQKIVCLAR